MTRSGRGGEALGMAAFASWFGGTISIICLLLIARPLAAIASTFGPPEYFLLALFGLTILISLSKEDPINGIISSVIGLLMGTVGLDIFDGTKRFTFGLLPLISGLPIVPSMIAMLSLPVVFRLACSEDKSLLSKDAVVNTRVIPSLQEIRRLLPNLIRSSLIGVFIGILPGVGGSIASVLAYDSEKKSRDTVLEQES